MGRRSHRAKPCAVTTPDPDTSALALRAQNSWRPTSWTESVRAVLLIGLLATFIYALVAHGGFFRPASTVILATALVTVALSILLSSNTRSLLAEDIALLGLAGWWLASAQLHHSVGSFVPLGASIVAFWASSMVVRDAPPHWKVVTNYVLVLAGAATALLGLVGCAVRWYPIAMRGQNIWRLSGTMTYSNAAGLLLAMTLLLSMSSLVSNRWRPLLVAVNAAGLVATESRGAVVAFILGAAFCARRECKGSWLALSSGVAAGLVMVARSTGHPHQVGALVISLVIVLLAAYSHPLEQIVKSRLTSSSSRYVRRFSVPAVTLAIFLVLGFLVRRQLVHRIDVGSNLGRLREWRAALNGISCFSISACVAVGSTVAVGSGPLQPVTVAGNPAAWGSATARSITLGSTFGGGGELNAISCTSATFCVGVGDDKNGQPITLSGNPTSWTATQAKEISLGGLGPSGRLNAVSCTSSTNCVAVGIDGNRLPLVLAGNPATWASINFSEVAIAPNQYGGKLTGISCTSLTNCVAVGYDFAGQPIVATGNPSGLVETELALGTFGTQGKFRAVTCTSATTCVAVGDDLQQPLVLAGNPATWAAAQIVELSVSAPVATTVGQLSTAFFPTGGSLASVSCSSATSCIAVGTDAQGGAMFVKGTPTSLGTQSISRPLATTAVSVANFGAVSCVSTACYVGGYTPNAFFVASL